MGPYTELAADKDGAFAKLMEWQLTGPPTKKRAANIEDEDSEELTEEKRMRLRMQEHDHAKGLTEEEKGEEEERRVMMTK